jgi:hypothetical protein
MSAQLIPDERRALELIAAESTGCPEHLLVTLGFSVELLSGLVRSGLTGVTSERVNSDPTGDMVFRLSVTERGRRALQAACEQGGGVAIENQAQAVRSRDVEAAQRIVAAHLPPEWRACKGARQAMEALAQAVADAMQAARGTATL